jgi:hypothetical protein
MSQRNEPTEESVNELIPIPPTLALQLRERAHTQGIRVETLATTILRDKLSEAA